MEKLNLGDDASAVNSIGDVFYPLLAVWTVSIMNKTDFGQMIEIYMTTLLLDMWM